MPRNVIGSLTITGVETGDLTFAERIYLVRELIREGASQYVRLKTEAGQDIEIDKLDEPTVTFTVNYGHKSL